MPSSLPFTEVESILTLSFVHTIPKASPQRQSLYTFKAAYMRRAMRVPLDTTDPLRERAYSEVA